MSEPGRAAPQRVRRGQVAQANQLFQDLGGRQGALDAVQRASPFGPAPSAIVSSDGNVYLHWEFHRDEVYACSTMNARPFLLNVPPKGSDPADPTLPPGTAPPPTQERGVPSGTESREGMLQPVSPPHIATL